MSIENSLKFLYQAPNDDLRILCDIVTKEKDGERRMTETLTDTAPYRRYYPDQIRKMLPALIHEFRLFGGNSIINFFRGEGPEYAEILHDVARKFRISLSEPLTDIEQTERLILGKLISDALHDASLSELNRVSSELDLHLSSFNRKKAISALTKLWKNDSVYGYLLMDSVVTSVIAQFTGKNARIPTDSTIARLWPLMLGPAGLTLTALWNVIDIAGPAYKVTVPAVIYIAYLRQKIKFNSYQN